jgi:DNA-binding beta-propeller fold protein YncE
MTRSATNPDMPRTVGRFSFAVRTMLAMAVLTFAQIGCRTPPAILSPTARIVWPPPPDQPRIRYLGEIRGESSLGRSRNFGQALAEVVTGPKAPIDFVAPSAVAARGQRVVVADPGAPGGAALYLLDLDARTLATVRVMADQALRWPIDAAFTADGFAVADAERAVVGMLDSNGQTRRLLGQARLKRPSAVAWDSARRELWVLDTAQHACLVFDENGGLLRTLGGRGAKPGAFSFPTGAAFGVIGSIRGAAVADAMNFRVQVLDAAGQPRFVFGKKGDAAGDFSLPRDVAIDSEGHMYVLDKQFENVQVFDNEGRLLLAFGEEGNGPGQFNLPSGISIDDQDRIWVADTRNRRVQVFQYVRESANE